MAHCGAHNTRKNHRIKAIIGAAALVFPRCYQRAGIVPSTVAIMVAGWAGVVVGDLLMETRRALGPRVSSFREMAVAVTGSPWGGVVLDATVALQSFGTLVGYVVACGDLVSGSLLRKGLNAPDEVYLPMQADWRYWLHGALTESFVAPPARILVGLRPLALICLTCFVFFPLCLLRKLESLRALAASTLVIYAIFLLVLGKEAIMRVVIGDLGHFTEDDDNGTPQVMPAAPLNWVSGYTNLMRVLPIIALSYSCVPLMIEVRRNLEKRVASQNKVDAAWRIVIIAAFAASGFFYLCTGFLGYIAFRGSTSVNVLTNLDNLGPLAMAVNALFVASLIVSYPLICFVVREPVRRVVLWCMALAGLRMAAHNAKKLKSESSVEDAVEESDDHGNNGNSDTDASGDDDDDVPVLLFVLEAAIVTGGTLMAAIAVPGIDVVLELIGGTAAVVVSYIAPVGLFLAVKPARTYEKDRLKAVLIGLSGAFVGVLTCYNLWRSFASHAQPASGAAQFQPPKPLPVQQ